MFPRYQKILFLIALLFYAVNWAIRFYLISFNSLIFHLGGAILILNFVLAVYVNSREPKFGDALAYTALLVQIFITISLFKSNFIF